MAHARAVHFASQNTVHPYDPNHRLHTRRPHVELYGGEMTRITGPEGTGALESPDFLIGAEMGLLIRSRRINHATARTLMDEISARLRLVNIPNHIHTRHDRSENHKDWTITEDVTIPTQPADHRFGVKVVSPFFRFGPGHQDTWIPLFDIVLTVLNCDFEITTHHQSSTHVHVVPARGHWTLPQAKNLASTALYFERCFDALVPYYRRRTVFAKSNRYNKYMGRRSVVECVDAIQRSTDSFPALAARMNWCDAKSATAEALGIEKDFPHEAYRWNFTGLGDNSGCSTIEFRQPPGVSDAMDAVKWIMVVGCFARLSCAFYVAPEIKPKLHSLGKWIRYEARLCGFSKAYVTELKNMFERADAVQFAPATAMDPEVISSDEAIRLRWVEMARWNVGRQKYKDKINHAKRIGGRV